MTSPTPRAKRPLVIVAVLLLLVGAAVAGREYWTKFSLKPEEQAAIEAKRELVLEKTDHTALRDACRAMIVKYGSPYVKEMTATDERVPPQIRRLEPSKIVLVQNYLRIELGSDKFRYGLESFRDRMSQVPFPISEELVEGLWYYENAGDELFTRLAK